MTKVIRNRVDAGLRLNDHSRAMHGVTQGESMKNPSTELPEQDKLGNYVDHLIVFADATRGTRSTSFGSRPTVEASVWVYVDDAWKDLGPTPIFWATVGTQVMDAMPDEIGGILVQGTERNPKEWVLAPATTKEHKALLAKWSKDAASF